MPRRSGPPTNDNRGQAVYGDGIELEGEGPFELMLVEHVEVAVGGDLALIELRTTKGQIVRAPLTLGVVADLHELTRQALETVGPDNSDTVP